MASEHLKKITNKAKQLRRANPKMKWTDAVKKASKLVKPAAKKAAPKKRAVAKKVSGVKKSAPKKTAVKKPSYKKPTWATKLQHMSWLVGRESGLKNVIEQIKSEMPLTPAKKKEIALYQRQLKAVQQQKAIEKKLI